MAIHWRLKTQLANRHGIFRVSDLQKRIAKKTGVLISRANLGKYLRRKPKAIRLTTLELICTALECKLSDFCEVHPSETILKRASQSKEVQKLSWKNTPYKKRAVHNFPDPKNYKNL